MIHAKVSGGERRGGAWKRTPLPYRRSHAERIAAVGLLNLTAAAVFLVLMQIDATTVLGIDRWARPLKFGFSVGIYPWTIAALMFFENLLIFTQAIRGDPPARPRTMIPTTNRNLGSNPATFQKNRRPRRRHHRRSIV